MPKTPIDIERLLHWAYRDELPKGYDSGGGEPAHSEAIWKYGVFIAASKWAREPGFPAAAGPPHPDALQIEWRVRQLPDVAIDWTSWLGGADGQSYASMIMGPFAPHLDRKHPAIARMRFSMSTLVQMHARMGTRPPWDIGKIKLRRMMGKNNKPLVRGITAGRRYADGAHCPLELYPPAPEIAAARAEYFAWRSALDWLADESWDLEDFAPQRTRATLAPWFGNDDPSPTKPPPSPRYKRQFLMSHEMEDAD